LRDEIAGIEGDPGRTLSLKTWRRAPPRRSRFEQPTNLLYGSRPVEVLTAIPARASSPSFGPTRLPLSTYTVVTDGSYSVRTRAQPARSRWSPAVAITSTTTARMPSPRPSWTSWWRSPRLGRVQPAPARTVPGSPPARVAELVLACAAAARSVTRASALSSDYHREEQRRGPFFPDLDRRAHAPGQEARPPGGEPQRGPAAPSLGGQDPRAHGRGHRLQR